MRKEEKIKVENEIKDLMKDFIKCEDKSNHYLPRFYFMFLEGNYGNFWDERKGYETYLYYKDMFSKNLSESSLIKHTLVAFRMFLTIEFFERGHLVTAHELDKLFNESFTEAQRGDFINHLVEKSLYMKEE